VSARFWHSVVCGSVIDGETHRQLGQ